MAASPQVEFVGLWARRPAAALEVAARHRTEAFSSVDALLDAVDAVVLSVPPAVQVDLGIRAARAGKALLCEKPLALDLGQARQFAEAVAAAGVVTQMVLTWRYSAAVRDFLAKVAEMALLGGRGIFVNSMLLGGDFATPWRLRHGVLLDLGPHVVDLLGAVFGPIERVTARGDAHRWVSLILEHGGGAVSEAALCAASAVPSAVAQLECYGPAGGLTLDLTQAYDHTTMQRVLEEFVVAVRGGVPHHLDVSHGLALQELLADAAAQLG